MEDFIFGLLPEIWEVNIFPYLFVALASVGIVGCLLKLIYN